MPSPPLVSVLIPAFNEAAGLDTLIARLRPVLDGLAVRWEIVFVDDGSRDDTFARLKAVASADPRISAISLSRNFGKEIAIAAGLTYVRGDACIIMDSDLQHPPEVLKAFVARWQEGFDVVYGRRLDRSTDSKTRTLLSRAFYRLYNALVDTDIPDGAGDFRLLDRKAIDAMNRLKETARFNKGLFSWIGFKATDVPYTVAERAHGTTKWSFRRLFRFAIDGLTSFSTLPLRVWSLLGLAISLAAFAYAILVLVQTLIFGVDVPGFPSLIISVMFFSGVQLISLGVIGEYLGRVYAEVKQRPLFLVGESVGFGPLAPTPVAPADAAPVAPADAAPAAAPPGPGA
ncbi:MAG: glycosyltransferase family 2 protein [Hyphomicrobiaceae bacterium]